MTNPNPVNAYALAVSLALVAPAWAQDGGLYENVADPDAAYVRVITVPNTPALVNTTSFDGLANGISPYVIIAEPGEVRVTAGTVEEVVTVTPGSWQTVVVSADGTATSLPDTVSASPAQANVSLVNLSDKPVVDLYVPAAKAVAVPAVASGQSAGVALKAPLTLDFEAREGDTVLAAISGIELKRRDGITFVFRGTAGSYELIAVANSIAK